LTGHRLLSRANPATDSKDAKIKTLYPSYHRQRDHLWDKALIYMSWDGQRARDITDLSDEQFVTFMRAEPADLVERKF
jgi:hypothetical protein